MSERLTPALPEVARRIDQAEAILLGLDFDGTLAPIQPRPDEVALSDSVRATLDRLAGLPTVDLMIVSGRSLDDVAARVALAGLIYAGNHGLEIQGPGIQFQQPQAVALAEPLRRLATRLQRDLADIPGALVEFKGLTASVHYRMAPPDAWDRVAHTVQDAVRPEADHFAIHSGHRVWEIRPRTAWHKGRAIEWVRRFLGDPSRRLVLYIGDDRTDEDAFASLPDGITVKVGDESAPTQAAYRVETPRDVEQFLNWLAAHHDPRPA